MGRGFTVMHIYSSDLKYMAVALPPGTEQAAIVRFLDHADQRIQRYIRAKEKLISLLEEERMAATLEALQCTSATNQRLGTASDLLWRPVERRDDCEYTPLGLYNRGRGFFKKDARSGDKLGDSDFSWVREGDLILSGQFAWEGAIALAARMRMVVSRAIATRFCKASGVYWRQGFCWPFCRRAGGSFCLTITREVLLVETDH